MPLDARDFKYSYSGADAKVWAYYDGLEASIVQLETLQTVSISVHEAKGQARALGHRGIKGLARGVRTIAGTMVLTVVNDHPLRNLIELVRNIPPVAHGGWSVDRDRTGRGAYGKEFQFINQLITLLPPFNLLIHYVSESGGTESGMSVLDYEAAAVMLKGVEFITMGMVTSVHDIITEVTATFLAHDIKPMASNDITVGIPIPISQDLINTEQIMARLGVNHPTDFVVGTVVADNYGTRFDAGVSKETSKLVDNYFSKFDSEDYVGSKLYRHKNRNE